MNKIKIIFSLILFIFLNNFSYGQWGINGSNILPWNWLGTINNQPLNIRTNNTQQMTILANGNVGIGVTAPNNTLQVVNLINFHPTNFSTFLGSLAGNNGSTGLRNTFVGSRAGNSNTVKSINT